MNAVNEIKVGVEKCGERHYGLNGDAILELDARVAALEGSLGALTANGESYHARILALEERGKDAPSAGDSPSAVGSIPVARDGASPAPPAEDAALVEECAKAVRAEWMRRTGETDAAYPAREAIHVVLAHLRSRGWDHYRELNAKIVATEKERDALREKLAAAEKELDIEKRSGLRADGSRYIYDSVAARIASHHNLAAERDRLRAERDALKAELAALSARPRFRTRKVTLDDATALRDRYLATIGNGSPSRDMRVALRALGFRIRVESKEPK